MTDELFINICGDGARVDWMLEFLKDNEINFVSFKGFLTDREYAELMSISDVCFVLQNPNGRYMNLKTPSKFFEYYSYGKFVISTKVGDYEDLPENSYEILEPFTAENLKDIIQHCINNNKAIEKARQAAYSFAQKNFIFEEAGLSIISELKI
jgi:hypothetical protein